MKKVNGKHYPLWSQFVDRKNEWIGGLLREDDSDGFAETEITDISLEPNGDESASFYIHGKDFSCGFGVRYGGVDGSRNWGDGWIVFSTVGMFSITFGIKQAA